MTTLRNISYSIEVDMETVRSKDGTRIAFELSGSGSPLILVHGTSADHTRWAPVLPALEKHFTVYAVDRRGRGGSGEATEYDIEREFEDITAVIDSIGHPANLFGHSYGGICALEAALRTSHVRRLILYEPPIQTGVKDLYPPQVVAELQALLRANKRDALVTLFLREIAGLSPQEVEVLRSAPAWVGRVAAAHTILREMSSANAYHFEAGRFTGFEIPTLLLLGGNSGLLFRGLSTG
jgi:pimeloyl-ACP methyl ester carboxylesterase